MLTYKVTSGQSLFDLALQLYGDCSKAFEIVQNNPQIDSLNSSNLANFVISYPQSTNETVEQLSLLNRIVNTSDPKINKGADFADDFSNDFNT